MAAAAAFAGNAEAVYKCTTAKGVVYQDRPCREGAESGVPIVMNTVELAKPGPNSDDSTQSNAGRQDGRSAGSKDGRSADDSAAVAKSGDNRGASASSANGAETKRNGRVVESVLPMSAEEARRTEPTAKYYTTDAAAPGAEAPESMTCESPSGEKRRFILSNGKLTSI